MDSKLILIVGKEQRSLVARLLVLGYDYIILRDQATSKLQASTDKKILCDFSTRQSVIQTIQQIQRPISATITLYENYIVPTSWINAHLGLPGMTLESAQACTDKILMRTAFTHSAQPISPDFAFVESEADVRSFAQTHSFPLILKPANLVKSLLVTKSDTLDELLANYAYTSETIEATYRQHAPSRQPRILIEEFLDGSLHSVAAFANQNGSPHILQQVVDLIPARERGFDDNFLYQRALPSQLSADDQTAIYDCASAGMQALKMKGTPAHIEVILTTKGPRIVEIGARNGGYRERMYDIACGIDIIQATIDAATGNTPDLAPTRDEPCAVVEIFPNTSGVFDSIAEAEAIAALPSCAYFAVKVEPGEQVGPASNGYKRCAIIMLHIADKQQFAKDLQFVQQYAHVQLQ